MILMTAYICVYLFSYRMWTKIIIECYPGIDSQLPLALDSSDIILLCTVFLCEKYS